MGRIAIAIYSLAGGGAERMAVTLSHEFIDAGHSVDFLLGAKEGDCLCLIPEGCDVVTPERLGAAHWRKSISSYIDRSKPHVLLGMMESASIIAIQASKKSKFKVPVVARISNHFSVHCRKSVRWKDRYLMPLAANWFLPKAIRIVAVSDGVRDDVISFARLNKEKVVTIYNTAFKEVIEYNSGRFLHRWLVSEKNWISVVTAGRLTEQKRQDVLIRSIALANTWTDTRLIVLGQGELETELRLLTRKLGIADKVDFLGFVDNPLDYFAQADVFALASAWEGCSNVLVEALGAGAAVVSTDCPSSPREILEHGRFGQLVSVGDVQGLANAILRAKEYPVDEGALAEHLKQFETRTVASEYLRVMGLGTP